MNYYKEREINNTLKIKELLTELPQFCSEFFIGIEQNTTTLTRLNYAHDLKIFFEFLKSEILGFKNIVITDLSVDFLNKITITHIEQFLSYLSLYSTNGKQVTNNEYGKSRKLSAIRNLFKYFYNKEKIPNNITNKIKNPKLRKKEIVRLTNEETLSLLDVVESGYGLTKKEYSFAIKTKNRDIAIFTLLLYTGIRISECVGLNIHDIDLEKKQFKVIRKGGNEQILYFNDKVKDTLEVYINTEREDMIKDLDTERIPDALFVSLKQNRLSARAIQSIVKKYSEIAVPLLNISPHKFRSTFGTNLYNASNDIYLVADVLGHKDVNTTVKHYVTTNEERRKIASEMVDYDK